MYLANTGPGVWRGRLSSGKRGTAETLELMRAMAREGARDPMVRAAAIRELMRRGVRGHDYAGEVRALFELVRDQIRFTRDPHKVETLQSPRQTLEWRAGDCDCRAILLAALLQSIGNPAKLMLRAIGVNRRRPDQFSHVYVVARMNGREVPLDPTWPWMNPGWQHPHPAVVGDLAL